MTPKIENTQQLALKAWEMYQSIIKNLSDGCWKIQSLHYTTSFALIAYAASSGAPLLYLANIPLAFLFFLLESGARRVMDQYIGKSLEIERTLTDILVGEEWPQLPAGGISTEIHTPTLKELILQLRFRKPLFWSSYLMIIVLSVALCVLGIHTQMKK